MPKSSRKVVSPPHPEPEPLGEALAFMQVLWAMAHGLESASKRMHAELGVTGPQRLVLRIIGQRGRISAGELAEVLRIDPSSLTGMLRRLEQAEMIRREHDPFDRRRALLELTRRGMRLNDQRQGTIEALVEDALGRLPAEQIATAKQVLSSVAAGLVSQDRPAVVGFARTKPNAKASEQASTKHRRKQPRN